MSDLGLSYYVRDLTSVGAPKTDLLHNIVSDEQVYKLNPDRYYFYLQLLDGLRNQSNNLVDTVLSIETKNRVTRQRIKDRSKSFAEAMKYLFTVDPRNTLDDLNDVSGDKYRKVHAVDVVNPLLQGNPMTSHVQLTAKSGGMQSGGGDQISGGKFDNLLQEFELAENAKKNPFLGEKENVDSVDAVTAKVKNDPVLSLDNEAITATDRIIFIATTFVIRTLALFIVEWGLNNFMIRTFQGAFNLYLGAYISIFLLWVMLTNASKKDLFFRMLFYYISTSPHGYMRVVLHLFVQLIFIPIPFLVKDKNVNDIDDDYSLVKRRSILRTTSSFTLFMWLLTSVIAIRL